MNTTKKFYTFLFSCLFFFSYAQKPPQKFGKISPADFKEERCPIDSNAHAYYVFDFGESDFKYQTSGNSGFQLIFTRHARLKIVDNQGFNWSNFEIPLYKSDGEEEKITSMKATTYNLENSKVVKSKLDKNDMLTEQTAENWSMRKFAMPNVKAGSIIELKYTVVSDFFFNLQEWYFQRSIPTLESEYHVSIPEYYNFSLVERGYFPIRINSDTDQNTISFRSSGGVQLRTGTRRPSKSEDVTYQEKVTHFYVENVPAFPKEKYLRTADNYISKVGFELASTQFPNSMMKYYSTDWDEINDRLFKHPNLGKALKKDKHLKEVAVLIKKETSEPKALMLTALNTIQKKMVWNEKNSAITSTSLSDSFKNGSGNAGDINLNLTALLRQVGLDAMPVTLSTQRHGMIHPAHPSIAMLNYVIAMVRIGEKSYLLDATDPNVQIGILPTRCLNGKGLIVNENKSDWINLLNNTAYSLTEVNKIDIKEDLTLAGQVDLRLSGYAAYDFRNQVVNAGSEEAFQSKLDDDDDQKIIENITLNGTSPAEKRMSISYSFDDKGYLKKAGDLIIFNPIIEPHISENPFKIEDRKYPVEYDHPYKILQNFSYTIPAGYEVSELPEAAAFSLLNGDAKYIYSISEFSNTITVSIRFSLKKLIYLPGEYQGIKNFYQMIMDKQNELIILKAK